MLNKKQVRIAAIMLIAHVIEKVTDEEPVPLDIFGIERMAGRMTAEERQDILHEMEDIADDILGNHKVQKYNSVQEIINYARKS